MTRRRSHHRPVRTIGTPEEAIMTTAQSMTKEYRLIVGVDGSPGGERALRWAVREAARRGGAVQAVTAFTFDGVDGASVHGREQRQQEAERMLGEQVVAALADNPRVAVTTRVVFGTASEVLLDSARRADLLVLGSHGRSRLRHALVGSVTEACVRGGGCPVVVVPAPAPQHRPAAAELSGIPSAIL
jgi:nucleotide-binding universal stress UspA family protein